MTYSLRSSSSRVRWMLCSLPFHSSQEPEVSPESQALRGTPGLTTPGSSDSSTWDTHPLLQAASLTSRITCKCSLTHRRLGLTPPTRVSVRGTLACALLTRSQGMQMRVVPGPHSENHGTWLHCVHLPHCHWIVLKISRDWSSEIFIDWSMET